MYPALGRPGSSLRASVKIGDFTWWQKEALTAWVRLIWN